MQSELGSLDNGGTLAENEVVLFCWGEMWDVMAAGAESLFLIYRSLTGHTALADWGWNGTGSAGWEDLSDALSWISPSSLPEKTTRSRCSTSLHKPESRRAVSTCRGALLYNPAGRERAAEAAQILG